VTRPTEGKPLGRRGEQRVISILDLGLHCKKLENRGEGKSGLKGNGPKGLAKEKSIKGKGVKKNHEKQRVSVV